ncbi:MAG TPA: hypothetical protein ENH10_05930, partial [Bacteroidetes bacterium]|nr:hypothetical protein [Bacteroidota bacterium]HEX04683.1 hypothetical protein [Bacteroidota bacterium]
MSRLTAMCVSLFMFASLVFASNDTPADPSIRPYQLQSSAAGLTLQFDEINVNWLAVDEGGEMPVLDGAGEIGVAGGPRLPVYSDLVAVPEGMDLVLLNVYAHWRDLGLHELAFDTGQEGETARDEMIFNRVIQESEETVVVGTTGRWRDLRIASVAVRPMKVDPVSGHVLIAEDLEIEFGYEPSTNFDEEFDPPGVSEAMLPLYEEYVINALDFIDYSEVVRGTYLMIYPPNWLIDVEALAEWRTKTGFTVQMASTDVTGNDFMSIYNYIFGVCETAEPALEYVVLVGDMDDYPDIATAFIDPGVPNPYDPDIATDQKYTYSLTGTSYEAVLPRFLIGRMSVDTQSELRALVNKIKQYEMTPFDGNPDRWLRAVTIANTTSSVSTALTQDWVAYKMVNNGFTNVEQLVKTWSFDPGTQAVANAINDNVSWVTYRGFGSHTSWAGPYFYNSDIDNRIFNTDNLPVITSMVCGGGAFDELGEDPCFGEKWIRHGTPSNLMGAVAFIAPSEIDTHTRWNNMILGGWYTAQF